MDRGKVPRCPETGTKTTSDDVGGTYNNDYVEGGGGCDVIFGGTGQDDLVGGSSSFFSLVTADLRPDREDMVFGGNGDHYARNDGWEEGSYAPTDASGVLLQELPDRSHSRDADVIAGDNADIIRLVGINSVDLIADDGVIADYEAAYLAADPQDALYLRFAYDIYPDAERIIVRGVTLLDYTPGGPDMQTALFDKDTPIDVDRNALLDPGADDLWRNTYGFWLQVDIGGNDEIHGEQDDDVIYVGGGNDIAFGDASDDDIIGGWGNDWISGRTGIDGIIGDDGQIFTSRNTGLSSDGAVSLKGNTHSYGNYTTEYAESLYGVFSLLNNDPDTRTSQGNVLNEVIYTPGYVQQTTINIEGELVKSVDLTPFDNVEGAILVPVSSADPTNHNPQHADDIIFGGLGDDFIHGGGGDDAITGGEALDEAYAPMVVGTYFEEGIEKDALMLVRSDFSRPWNSGDVLMFGDGDPHWNEPKPVQERTGEFYLYDEYDSPLVILFHDKEVDTDGDGISDTTVSVVWQGEVPIDDPSLRHWILNQADDEGDLVESYVDFTPNGSAPADGAVLVAVQSDGNDAIFGDMGNDWIVGGTGRDHIYGGFGNDLMNADDVMGGPGSAYDTGAFGVDAGGTGDRGLNDTPETHLSWEDRVFGGAGLDVLIGNTGGDRLIDHLGEFNSYIVPFAPFGISTVSRQVPPHLWDFLAGQAYSDGVDLTRTTDIGQNNLRSRYSWVFDQQGEPYGKMGLVVQQDHGFWQDQPGPSTDPQAGNIPGGRRDILRTADFNNRSLDGFAPDRGKFTATGGRLQYRLPLAKTPQPQCSCWMTGSQPILRSSRPSISTNLPRAGNRTPMSSSTITATSISSSQASMSQPTRSRWAMSTKRVGTTSSSQTSRSASSRV
ncbi:hypothetical protein [Palleronia caenipelagi]|uniref:Calcium-binding protein n=1 Tax=Palleronia caenipelagi TaxID=2489174 RepID=A0A547PUQ4_9RHOB|nr:hypothetical protein [Palleronia caenipelagi]TRD17848.1 hypothetical protein FEV53_12335 [Palleronia caenipelagi]